MRFWTAFLASIACLYGAGGVALAAAAAHVAGGGSAATAANFLLFHAGALAALAAAAAFASRRPLLLCIAASLIALGLALFAGDLAARGLAGIALLRMMAPTGGMLMIAGWLLAAVALPLALRRDTACVR